MASRLQRKWRHCASRSPASPHKRAWSTIPCPIGQPVQKPSAAVEGQVHVGEIRKLALGGHDAVEGTEDRDGEASVGQPVLPAATHVDALAGALGVPFLQLADQGRQPRAGGVVLVDVPTEAALQGGAVIPLHTGLDFVAFEAQGLELQGLPLVGLPHRNDVVQLAGLRSDERPAELAHPVLFCQQSRSAAAGVVPAPLQQVQEDIKARPGQPLPSVGHAQALRPLLQHLRILAELPNHAVASRRSQAQGGPLAESSERHLGLVPRCEQLGPHASQVFAPEVATPDLPGPGLPLREFGSAGVLALPTVAMPLCFVAAHHGPGAFVEEGVAVPGGVGYPETPMFLN